VPREAKVRQQHRGPIRAERARVQAHVQQPILLRRRRWHRRVQQKAPGRILQLDTDLHAQRRLLIQPHQRDAIQVQLAEQRREFRVRVVPEDDAVAVLVEALGEGGLDAV
jgi:hypothetical protein